MSCLVRWDLVCLACEFEFHTDPMVSLVGSITPLLYIAVFIASRFNNDTIFQC